MAENTVVKEHLTVAMMDAGAELTRKLDEIGLHPTAAFWLFDPELNEWRLIFASPDVNERGPREVYQRILDALGDLKEKAEAAPFSSIALMDSNAQLVRLLRTAVRTPVTAVGRIRFSKSAIDGHFIDDAFIYRAA